jgi:N-acetylglucosaminyl-diphospho-decaprenol L-rhamnosyltransferase
MSEQTPLVSIVAVNYNGRELVDRYMAGIRRTAYRPLEVLVVDNASSDGSAEVFAAMPEVELVRSRQNLGFGRACNLGAERASGALLLFMNPDVILAPDTVSVLVSDWQANPDAAIVIATTLVSGFHHAREDRVEDVASMAAAAMLVERAHFERIGGFDPWIFLYSEDDDLCYRTWLAGRRVLKAWNAVAEHSVGGTGGGHRWSGEQIKNGLYVYLKLRAWPAVIRYAGRMAAKTLIRGVRLHDPSVLSGWSVNARELRQTLAKRRTIRDAADPADRALLEHLGADNAYWARRAWRRKVMLAWRARLASGSSRGQI